MGGSESKGGQTVLMPRGINATSDETLRRSIELGIDRKLKELEWEILSAFIELARHRGADFTPNLQLFSYLKSQDFKAAMAQAEHKKPEIMRIIRTKQPCLSPPPDESQTSEHLNRPIRCMHWNCGGLRAQLMSENGFLFFLHVVNPDLILLNEVKYSGDVNSIAFALGYKHVGVMSRRGVRQALRGSSILYKENVLGPLVKSLEKVALDGDIEAICGDFKVCEILRRFVSVYFNHKKDALSDLVSVFDSMRGPWAVIAGDLNIKPKSKWLPRLADKGYVDCMNPEWTTNRSGKSTSESDIDYILCAPAFRKDILCHKPFAPLGQSVHFPVCFDVYPGINSSGKWCQDATCNMCHVATVSENMIPSEYREHLEL